LQTLYNFGIQLYGLFIRITSLFSGKARDFISGRKNWKKNLEASNKSSLPTIWLHAASLGEMEQGVPILRQLRKALPEHQFLITFFSPSGFNNFKQRDLAEQILYLPLDTPQNAKEFITLIQPDIAIFIKYEIWVNYFRVLKQKNIPLILAPAVFRPEQIYFKAYARSFFIPILRNISSILVQNEASLNLLENHNIRGAEICGDSRFDQAIANKNEDYPSEKVEQFLGKSFCLTLGSSWPPEEDILEQSLSSFPSVKVILAPHDVSPNNIKRIETKFSPFGVSKFSEEKWATENAILLIDNIGQLKKLYRFADFALIGGGFGAGLHSTVEAIVYGIPVAFGPKHYKFIEVSEYLDHEIGFEMKTAADFLSILRKLESEDYRQKLRIEIERYLESKTGAADTISHKALQLFRSKKE
jgi:3-deoxy-D-manno-octulosonic-acid transferase